MGTRGARTLPRALSPAVPAGEPAEASPAGEPSTTGADRRRRPKPGWELSNWPVAVRLFTVILAAVVMGLVFGGLRVADARSNAGQLSRTLRLADLDARLIPVVDDLQNERDATLVALVSGNDTGLAQLRAKTNGDLGPVRAGLGQVMNGGFPAAIAANARGVSTALSVRGISQLRNLADTALPSGDVVSADYEAVIAGIITLQNQVAFGITDQSLANGVQALTALSTAKDLTSQQLALLDQSLSNQGNSRVGGAGFLSFATETNLQVDSIDESNHETAFRSTATPAENAMLNSLLGPQAAKADGETLSDSIEQALFTVASGQAADRAVAGSSGISYPLFIATQPLPADRATLKQDGITTTALLKAAWDKGTDAKLGAMRATERFVAGDIVNRATQLQGSAQQTELNLIAVTVAVLLIVLLAALVVARSLVRPLRRLRAGALDIASAQLPERVHLLSVNPESAAATDVAPIDVTSRDEIGQVARAFDRVHAEAVRLAGDQARLRSNFNGMFVNLSRRSQTLIERLARMIDTLEQNEDDPDRLGNLFAMDHLVTRMRRNSENLLLLAGHENPRKWSEPLPLSDVARAATSEIEQYNRVTLNIRPGISVTGQAVSDVAHLLAELIENATTFSPKDTQVLVATQELASGGALIEIVDQGIGISDARLAEVNWRLDNPPEIDVSVSRHMGLFAVARLAERHRVRVRLRPASPQGLSALVWLPETIIARGRPGSATAGWQAQTADTPTQPPSPQLASLSAIPPPPGTQPPGTQPPGTSATGPQPLAPRARAGAPEVPSPAPDGKFGLGTGQARGGKGNPALEGRTASGWFRGGENGAAADGGGGYPPGTLIEPSYSRQTAAGLPVRVPRANMPPGSGASGSQAGPPARPSGKETVPGDGARSANSDSKMLPQRTAEQARSRLAAFQRGTRRAQGQDANGGQAPRAEEGTLS